jgi:hypothetical protein
MKNYFKILYKILWIYEKYQNTRKDKMEQNIFHGKESIYFLFIFLK